RARSGARHGSEASTSVPPNSSTSWAGSWAGSGAGSWAGSESSSPPLHWPPLHTRCSIRIRASRGVASLKQQYGRSRSGSTTRNPARRAVGGPLMVSSVARDPRAMDEGALARAIVARDLALAAEQPAIGDQALHPHRAACVQLAGADAHLGAQAVAVAVGEAGAGVVEHPGRV